MRTNQGEIFMLKKLLVILSLSIVVLTMYGCASEVEKHLTSETIQKEISTNLTHIKNTKIHTAFLEKAQSEKSTKEDYIQIINDWLKNNSNKTIVSLTNYPSQREVYGLFITYSNEPLKVKYSVIGYDIAEFRNNKLYKKETFTENYDTENNINFICSYSENLNIVTETTINDWRGGIKYLLLIIAQ